MRACVGEGGGVGEGYVCVCGGGVGGGGGEEEGEDRMKSSEKIPRERRVADEDWIDKSTVVVHGHGLVTLPFRTSGAAKQAISLPT